MSKFGDFLRRNESSIVSGLGSISGGVSGSSDASGAVSGVATAVGTILGGPVGGAVGSTIGSILGGLLGPEAGRGCFGSQAYDSNNLREDYEKTKVALSKVKLEDGQNTAGFINWLSFEIAVKTSVKERLRSRCSKENTQSCIDFYDGLIKQLLAASPFEFKQTTASKPDYRGVDTNYRYYEPMGRKNSGSSGSLGDVFGKIPSDISPISEMPVSGGNLLEGLDPSLYTPGYIPPGTEIEGLELLNNGNPTWSIGGGGRTGEGVDWSFGAGKTQEDPTMRYIMLGLLGLVAYKVLFDKR